MIRRLLQICLTAVLFSCQAAPAQVEAAKGTDGCAPEGTTRFVCIPSATEDLILVPQTNWVLGSGITGEGGLRAINSLNHAAHLLYPTPGSADAWDKKTYGSCPGPLNGEDRSKFITHGLALGRASRTGMTLYAIHHGSRESIEVFTLKTSGRTPSVTWVGCVLAPESAMLNALTALPDGSIITTNMLRLGADQETKRAMSLGTNSGELWQWRPAHGWTKVPGSEGSGLNGIISSADGKTIYVAAWGIQSLYRLTNVGGALKRDMVQLGFRVDNLRWAPNGKILVAGQIFLDANLAPQGTRIVTIDPRTLAVTELLERPETSSFGGGTVAINVEKDLWIGSFRIPRIAIVPMPRSGPKF